MHLSPRLSRFLLVAVPLACCLCTAPAVQAQVIFDNFGPGNTFQAGMGWTKAAPPSTRGAFSQGEGFPPAINGNLSTIEIAIGHVNGTNDLHLFLSDGTTGTPGTTLESWVV